MVDITRDKPIRVAIRVVVPVRDHPKFNFVGKLLGPKGNSLKRLQEDTMCKMAVLGRGSMRDRHKEEELRASGDPKFQHLSEDLHVEISAFATPAEAHARIAYALAEVRRFLVPDYNDDIRQEQMWEMKILSNQKNNLDLPPDQQQSILNHDNINTVQSTMGPASTRIFNTQQQMIMQAQQTTNHHHLQQPLNGNDTTNGNHQIQLQMQQQQSNNDPQQPNQQQTQPQQQTAPTSSQPPTQPPLLGNSSVEQQIIDHHYQINHHSTTTITNNEHKTDIEATIMQQQNIQQQNQQMMQQQQQQQTQPRLKSNNCLNGSVSPNENQQNLLAQQHPAIRGTTTPNCSASVLTSTTSATQGGVGMIGTNGTLIAAHHHNCTTAATAATTMVPVNGGIISPSPTTGIIAPIAINVNQGIPHNAMNFDSCFCVSADCLMDKDPSIKSDDLVGYYLERPIYRSGGVIGRKRPLMVSSARTSMTPTKRTVMSLLARARAAQAKQLPATFQRAAAATAERTATLVPLLSEDYMASAVNLNIV